MKKYLIILFKLFVSVSVIIYYFSRIDLFLYLKILKQVNPYYFLAAVAVYFVSLLVYSCKWRLLLKMMDLKYGYWRLLRINLIGMFYAAFLPGGFLAGETVKGYKISKGENNKAKKVFSIIIDRLTGAISFILVGTTCLLISDFYLKEIIMLYIILFIGAIFVYMVIIIPGPRQKIKSLLLKLFKKHDTNFLDKEKYINSIFINMSLLLGIIFQLMITAGLYFIILSVGLKINFIDLIWINALVSAATTLPISILGIGPREISFVYLFGLFGFAETGSLIIATLMVVVLILRGLPGGLIELRDYYR